MNTEQHLGSPSAREQQLQDLTVALGVLQRTFRTAAEKEIGHLGISHAAAWALVTIGRQGSGARQGVVADLIGVEGPTLVRTLDHLVAAGLVERHEDASDRRAKTLHITPEGSAIQVQIEAMLQALRNKLFAGIPDNEIAGCLRVLSMLGQALGRAPIQSVQPARPDS
jgi:MarR family transcriptional regulator for hemolysin